MGLTNHDSTIWAMLNDISSQQRKALIHLLQRIEDPVLDFAGEEADIVGGAIDKTLLHGLDLTTPMLKAGVVKLSTAIHLLDAPPGPPPADPTTATPGS